ncbi:MAG: 30S ribosomal protein S12 methylthiotransferase RimO, partial [Spirochaetaceae bacterium]|nr:30S ribosomal protein S12 methylthiotransferase RimO [Spirochaetaceae bacterium]
MSFKKIYIDNLGCAKNQVNAEIMVASLSEAGYRLSEAADADVIIVNSCGFVESAKKEAIQHFFSAKNNYKAKIVFAGCMAERYGDELKELLTEADGLYAGKPEVVGSFVEQLQGNPIIKAAAGPLKRKERFSFNGSAYLKIAEGCNNGCRYCAIPLIKGPLISRNSAEIINEFNFLLEDGVKEINLIAQDLASYGFDKGQSLYQLLKELSKIDKTFYARLLYLHPDLFPLEILELIANDSRFLPYFDIPFQHA